MAEITPSQTIGPFFAYGLTPGRDYPWSEIITSNLLGPEVSGAKIRIEGRVFDGDGAPVSDAMLEIWQADAGGRFDHPQDPRGKPNTSFRGYGRCGTDKDGRFVFDTVKPGQVPGPEGKPQAPHITIMLFARGMLTHCTTRLYFPDEAANGADPILALVPADRRTTLIAHKQDSDHGPVYVFDIHLQGDRETVFFQS